MTPKRTDPTKKRHRPPSHILYGKSPLRKLRRGDFDAASAELPYTESDTRRRRCLFFFLNSRLLKGLRQNDLHPEHPELLEIVDHAVVVGHDPLHDAVAQAVGVPLGLGGA